MLAAIAEGTSTLRNWLPSGDTMATFQAIRDLGLEIVVKNRSVKAWDIQLTGKGLFGLIPPVKPLDCRNAGTCMRLLTGIMAGQDFESILDGSDQLRMRPMGRILKPLRQMGARIDGLDDRAPIRIKPSNLRGIVYQLPVASAQVKSAILLAGLFAHGQTRVQEPGPTRNHTERMLTAMGANLVVKDEWITISRQESALSPLDITVPGDISSAAFSIVAASIVPHSKITVSGVGLNETRIGLLDILATMGASFRKSNLHTMGGEPAADLTVQFEELHSMHVRGDLVVRAIDEFPILAVAATQAAGENIVREAAELRVKEVDRIALVAAELRKMGADILEYPDGMTISGPIRLHGAQVNSHGDHRLGMALVVASLAAYSESMVDNADCIADSFPGFVETMRQLGADLEWIE
jgi:3-phosphoshikimate 1-carboxyvinyltransferase